MGWRMSADASVVLSSPEYQVFDEWWGNSTDNFAKVVGREMDAGRVRVRHGAHRIFEDDLRPDPRLVVCWHAGALYATKRFSKIIDTVPCFGMHRASAPRQICLFHLITTKRLAPIRE